MDDSRSKLEYTKNENVFEVEEILTNILSRLPVKSLLICKSVSKYWWSVISSSSFMHLHLIQSQQNPSYVFYRHAYSDDNTHLLHLLTKTDGETTQSFPCCDGFYRKVMICSFNGLICCINNMCGMCSTPHITRTTRDIIICNPATRKVLILPPTPRSQSVPKLGFSFGPTINGYKLFQFFYIKQQLYECMVYSSITGSWKSIGSVAHRPHSSPNHVCINGMVYWFSKSRIDERLVGHILAVDREEFFSIIRIPEEKTIRPFLINLEGCLCLVAVAENIVDKNRSNKFDIWVLHDNKESVWVKKWSDYIPISNIKHVNYVAVPKNEILFASLTQYFFYDMGTKTGREFKCEPDYKFGFCLPMAYTESLLPCNGRIDS